MYRGALFGSAIVILMLTASTRSHEVLQISADRFVTPVCVYVVNNVDGTPKRDPVTKQLVTNVIRPAAPASKGSKRRRPTAGIRRQCSSRASSGDHASPQSSAWRSNPGSA